MILRAISILVVLAAAWPASAQNRFQDWTAAIVAADWRTSRGDPIQAFDNARRDLTAGFLKAGFARENLVDYSLRPDLAEPVTADQVLEGVGAAMAAGRTGCFLYFTSHGSPRGIVFGPGRLVVDIDVGAEAERVYVCADGLPKRADAGEVDH